MCAWADAHSTQLFIPYLGSSWCDITRHSYCRHWNTVERALNCLWKKWNLCIAQRHILWRYQSGTGNRLQHCCSLPPEINLFWTQLAGSLEGQCCMDVAYIALKSPTSLFLYLTSAPWHDIQIHSINWHSQQSSTPLHPILPSTDL